MSDWSMKDLKSWDDKIIKIANKYNLDWFEIQYEVCNYYEMIGHMSYHGLPSHYSHWSYGKSFEVTHQMYNAGLQGLPYELIINSNPSIAYLMKENPLYLQVLIMAHCVGHSDFFKNNMTFKDTDPNRSIQRFRSARNRIQKYIEDPLIGIEKVESILDAAHSIKYQINRDCSDREDFKTKREKKINDLNVRINKEKLSKEEIEREMKKIDHPIDSADYDLLGFIIENSPILSDWARDLVSIVKVESQYFIPQIKTKVLNEGWASFWHYKIINELDLPQSFHIPFMKMHNLVVSPRVSSINPYHLGFYLFNRIEKEKGLEECFFVREVFHDEAAIRALMTLEDFQELNLFSYAFNRRNNNYNILDVADDEDAFKRIRNDLISNVSTNSIPSVYAADVYDDGTLILEHDHDGRDLELQYANNVVENIKTLWGEKVKLFTIVENETWEI